MQCRGPLSSHSASPVSGEGDGDIQQVSKLQPVPQSNCVRREGLQSRAC